MEALKGMRSAVLLAAVFSALLAGCGVFERPGVQEPPTVTKAPPPRPALRTPTPPPRPSPTPAASPTRTATRIPVKLPEECEAILDDVKLTDLLKHRQLVSMALELEFKGRYDEAIAVLGEALKLRPDNELTRMKIEQLTREAGRLERIAAARAQAEKGRAVAVEEAPRGLGLPDEYLDILNSAMLGACAKGYRLFVLGARLEEEAKLRAALYLYEKAVSLCPEEDGPNETINRQARARIAIVEKRLRAAQTPLTTESTKKK